MTEREKIEAAFSKEGTPQIAAVMCYEDLYIRDHWNHLTDCPWWYQHVPDLERQMKWRRDVNAKTGHDMFILPYLYTYTSEDRKHITIESRPQGVFRIDSRLSCSDGTVSGAFFERKNQFISGHRFHVNFYCTLFDK